MKRWIIISTCIVMLLSFVACKPIDARAKDTIVVMSYNVRVFSTEDRDIGLGLEERMPLMQDKINTYSPDILAMQEVCSVHMDYFAKDYADIYDYVLEYRSNISVTFNRPEASPIFYKKEKFELLDSGTFWLSETPQKMSKGWDAKHYRVCTYVKLLVKSTQEIMYVYNTHLDFGEISRPKSIELILDTLSLDYPCVLTGDFNLTPDTSFYADITSVLEDSRIVAQSTMKDSTTFNDYLQGEGKLLDYFYLSKGHFEVIKYMVSNDDVEKYGMFASDHYPILTYIKIINNA